MQSNISDKDKGKRVYREISQKYCSHLDDNVIIVRESNYPSSHYECMSAHLCGKAENTALNSVTDNSSISNSSVEQKQSGSIINCPRGI